MFSLGLLGRLDEAEVELLAGLEQAFPGNPWEVATARALLSDFLERSGRADEAAALEDAAGR